MNTFEDPTINTWLQYQGAEAEDFLHGLRDTSMARVWCRKKIMEYTMEGMRSILEIGVGGLNERIALNDFLESMKAGRQRISYAGTDWAKNFTDNGKRLFPNDNWFLCDIVKGDTHQGMFNADIVYSQHVLEHCGGLTPALPNMLGFTKRVLLNIFFLPPTDQPDYVHYFQYPRYHNTYSRSHIEKVCDYHGFSTEFLEFTNEQDPKRETVLIATRR